MLLGALWAWHLSCDPQMLSGLIQTARNSSFPYKPSIQLHTCTHRNQSGETGFSDILPPCMCHFPTGVLFTPGGSEVSRTCQVSAPRVGSTCEARAGESDGVPFSCCTARATRTQGTC